MPTPSPDTVCYFDANALWKFYRDEPGDLNVRRLVSNATTQILISQLTMLEFIGVLLKYYRKGHLKRGQIRALAKRMRRDAATVSSNRPFRVTPLPAGAFLAAQSVLLQHGYQYNIQANDSLHLAIVLKLPEAGSVVVVTCDNSMTHTARRERVQCYNPETEELA